MTHTDSRSLLEDRLTQTRIASVLIELVDVLNKHQIAMRKILAEDRVGAAGDLMTASKRLAYAADQIGLLVEADGS